jgi:hypothetical protein
MPPHEWPKIWKAVDWGIRREVGVEDAVAGEVAAHANMVAPAAAHKTIRRRSIVYSPLPLKRILSPD